jgi:putative endonuclease
MHGMGENLPQQCYVYVLASTGKGGVRTYVGWTLDLDRRLAQHNGGRGARSTRGRVWVLLHSESYATRGEAMSREWHLKRDRALRRTLSQRFAESVAGAHPPRGQRSTKARSMTK